MTGSYSLLRSDVLLAASPETLTAVQDYAGDKDGFLEDLANVWTKMMNADRFDGPTGNLCEPMKMSEPDSGSEPGSEASLNGGLIAAVVVLLLAVLILLGLLLNKTGKASEDKEAHKGTLELQGKTSV